MKPDAFKMAREISGVPVDAAAEGIGVSERTMRNYEGGRSYPTPDVAAGMAKVYRNPFLAEMYCRECPVGQLRREQKKKATKVAAR